MEIVSRYVALFIKYVLVFYLSVWLFGYIWLNLYTIGFDYNFLEYSKQIIIRVPSELWLWLIGQTFLPIIVTYIYAIVLLADKSNPIKEYKLTTL